MLFYPNTPIKLFFDGGTSQSKTQFFLHHGYEFLSWSAAFCELGRKVFGIALCLDLYSI